MRESMQARAVTAAHVEAALQVVRPSLDPAQVAHLATYAERRASRSEELLPAARPAPAGPSTTTSARSRSCAGPSSLLLHTISPGTPARAQLVDRVERRQVAHVVAGEQHRRRRRLAQREQRAALVGAGRPHLEHEAAGVHLQPVRLCEAAHDRLEPGQRAVRVGQPGGRGRPATGPCPRAGRRRSPAAGPRGSSAMPGATGWPTSSPSHRWVPYWPSTSRPGTSCRPPSSTTRRRGGRSPGRGCRPGRRGRAARRRRPARGRRRRGRRRSGRACRRSRARRVRGPDRRAGRRGPRGPRRCAAQPRSRVTTRVRPRPGRPSRRGSTLGTSCARASRSAAARWPAS